MNKKELKYALKENDENHIFQHINTIKEHYYNLINNLYKVYLDNDSDLKTLFSFIKNF